VASFGQLASYVTVNHATSRGLETELRMYFEKICFKLSCLRLAEIIPLNSWCSWNVINTLRRVAKHQVLCGEQFNGWFITARRRLKQPDKSRKIDVKRDGLYIPKL